MGSPEVLDFAAILAPIPGENPAGVDPRSDPSPTSFYYVIKDARNRARADERRLETAEADEKSKIKPDWRPVEQEGIKALTGSSKDLEIAAYLVEALVRLRGLAGLRDGFRLLREFCSHFWDQGLYPLPDEEGIETRVFPLVGLNGADATGTLIGPIERIRITEGTSEGPFAYFELRDARALASLPPEQQQAKMEQGAVSLDRFNRAVNETGADFYRQLLADVEAANDEFWKLSDVLDSKCGSNPPPTSNIRGALTEVREAIEELAKRKIPVGDDGAGGDEADAGPAGSAGGHHGIGAGPMRTREDALRTVSLAADFFRATEPHTPISFALDQIVRWGRMPLPDLLSELIPDTNARDQLFKMVGIASPPPSDGG